MSRVLMNRADKVSAKRSQGYTATVAEHMGELTVRESRKEKTEKLENLEAAISDVFGQDGTELAGRIRDVARARISEGSTRAGEIGNDVRRLNERFMSRAITLILKGTSRKGVARQLGVHPKYHDKWLNEGKNLLLAYDSDPEMQVSNYEVLKMQYYESVVTAEGLNETELLTYINEAATEDWRAATWLMARRYPKDWGAGREKMEIKHTGEVEVKHNGVLAVAPVAASIEEWQKRTSAPIETTGVKIIDMSDSE